MRISAVITTCKRDFSILKRSIESVRNQTLPVTEIVIVDDNSEDTPLRKELESKLSGQHGILHIRHSTNLGAQVSRNDGILAATGDYIAFLDDDDEWLPEKIERQIALIEPNVGLVYCMGQTVIVGQGEPKVIPYANTKNFAPEVTFQDLLFSDRIGTTTQALIPRSVFTACGLFDVNQPARQDYEMWLRISQKFRCVGVPEVLFKHYIHESEQISRNPTKAIAGYRGLYRKYGKEYRKNPVARFRLFLTLAVEYRKNKDWWGFLISSIKSFSYLLISSITRRKELFLRLKQK